MVDQFIVYSIIILAIVLFTTEWLSVEVTALLVMVSLMLTDIISLEEAVSGFSNPATLTVLAMLMLSIGIQQNGIIYFIGKRALALKLNNEITVLAIIMLASGCISAFINNTAVVAIFLPLVVKVGREKQLSVNKLLMSLSFGSMLGGSVTLIGSSTNLLVDDIAIKHDMAPFGMFDLSVVGFVVFVLLVALLIFVGRHLIIERRKKEDSLTKSFDVQDYISELRIPESSKLVGQPLSNTKLVQSEEIKVLQIKRGNEVNYLPSDIRVLQANDIILIKTNTRGIVKLNKRKDLELLLLPDIEVKNRERIQDQELEENGGALVEVIIGPNSSLVGHKLKEVPFQNRYQAIPLALRYNKGIKVNQIDNVLLKSGYAMLLETTQQAIPTLQDSADFIFVKSYENLKLDTKKAWLACVIVFGVVSLASFGFLPILVSAWLGCVAMFLTGCLRIQKVYDTLDWKIFFLLAGLIPLGIALESSGIGASLGNLLTDHLSVYGPKVVLSALFLITAILSGYVSNNAVAVLIAPIAIIVANNLGVAPKPFLLAIIFAANSSFLTPIGYQTNTMIYGAGKFKFKDFYVVGGLMMLAAWLLVSFLIPWLYF